MNESVLFPLARPVVDRTNADVAAPGNRAGRHRILVVDDEPALARMIGLVLAQAGYEVETAGDGEQGWAALNEKRYDLLMTDNDMPKLRGLALVRRLRSAGMALPVIVVSGSEEVRHSSGDDFLHLAAVIPKPFNPVVLLAEVERACRTLAA